MLAIHSFRYVVNDKHVVCLSSRPSRAVRTGLPPFSLAILLYVFADSLSTMLLTVVHNRENWPKEEVLLAVDSQGSVFDHTTTSIGRLEFLH